MMGSVAQDIRIAFRILRKRTLFAGMVMGTLALGIGATTTMFSVVYGVLLRPFAYADPSALVTFWTDWPDTGRERGLHWMEYEAIRERGSLLQESAVHRLEGLILTGSGDPASLVAGVTSGSLFPLLGVRPHLGRFFREDESGSGAQRLVVLSGELWQTRFGSDPSVIGRTVLLDERPFEVIGVAPPGFRLRSRPGDPGREEIESRVDTGERDVWLPAGYYEGEVQEWAFWNFIGRLRPGVTLDQVHQESEAILGSLGEPFASVIGLDHLRSNDTSGLRFPLFLLLGAAGVLSLVACANVANLQVSAAIGRRREIMTRTALGASKSRIVRQLLAESTALGLAGSLLGSLVAMAGVRSIVAFGPYLPGLETVRVDHRVLLFAIALGLATGLIFGLAPALGSARVSPGLSAGSGREKGAGVFQHRILGLVFALTMVLLVTGGLLTRSFWNLVQLDTGFEADGVATVRLPVLPTWRRDLEVRNAFFSDVIQQVEAIPGVVRASGADNLPFPGAMSGHRFSLPGGEEDYRAPLRRVLPAYHEAMEIPILAGRGIEEGDVPGSVPVAVISEGVAQDLWPDGSALGATLHHNVYGDLVVVGIVGEVMEGWVERVAKPMVYLSLPQISQGEISLIARTRGDPGSILPRMREAVWSINEDVAVTMEATMKELVAESSLSERYRTLLVMCFGISATLLAAVGVFGVVARSIASRVRELGIRVALGASGRRLVGMVLRQSLTTALTGIIVGLLIAMWASRMVAGYLFGVEPLDPLTFASVAVFLALVGLSAAYLPTRRVLRFDPVRALKVE
jgi:predicted permease